MPSTRSRRWVLPAFLVLLWLVLGGAMGPLAGQLNSVIKNDNASFLPAKAESTKVLTESAAIIGGSSPLPATIIWEKDSGISQADRSKFDQFLATVPGISLKDGKTVGDFLVPAPVTSTVAQDGGAIQALLLFDDKKSALQFEDGTAPVGIAVKAIREALKQSGISANVGGFGGVLADLFEAFGDINGKLLLATVGIVAIILIFVYRSPVLWIVPLLVVAMGDSIAQAVIYLLAKSELLTLNGQAQGILLVLVFGVGTDYSLLLVSRFREELHNYESKYDAMRVTLRGVVEPVLASAATVAVGLLCLTFSELNSNKSTGPVSAIGVACAMVAVLTLLPALLVLFGRKLFWPFVPKFGQPSHLETGLWSRVSSLVGRRHRSAWILASIVMFGFVSLVPTLKADGITQTEAFTTRVDSVIAQEAISRHFPAGEGSPAQVIAPADRINDVIATVTKEESVAFAAPFVAPGQTAPVVANGKALVNVVLKDAADSREAAQAIERLRVELDAVSPDVLVGGFSAINLDTRNSSVRDTRVIIPIVLIVIFFILALLLRALLAPLLLIGSVVLSFFATLGVCAFFFNNVFDFPGADASFPLFAFTFLVALGVDYNIFLMTRVREETLKIGTRAGVLKALTVTGGVITSAGVVLAATFAVLGLLPLVFLAELGFAVALGVLIDTIIVRSVIVPALVHDMGSVIWWPSKLRKEKA